MSSVSYDIEILPSPETVSDGPLVVGVDGSPASTAAVDASVRLAQEIDAPIVFVYVRRGPSGLLGEPFYQRRLSAELTRAQPFGTNIRVDSIDLRTISSFAMFIQVTGMEDRTSLLDFVDQQITPRLGAVEGIASVQSGGGAPREMTVTIPPDKLFRPPR